MLEKILGEGNGVPAMRLGQGLTLLTLGFALEQRSLSSNPSIFLGQIPHLSEKPRNPQQTASIHIRVDYMGSCLSMHPGRTARKVVKHTGCRNTEKIHQQYKC